MKNYNLTHSFNLDNQDWLVTEEIFNIIKPLVPKAQAANDGSAVYGLLWLAEEAGAAKKI